MSNGLLLVRLEVLDKYLLVDSVTSLDRFLGNRSRAKGNIIHIFLLDIHLLGSKKATSWSGPNAPCAFS